MLLSNFFLPLLKEDPHEAQVISHKLMLRAGMIKQSCAGIYTWLPLGLMVIRNIEKIIHKNMQEIGASEVLMSCIQPADFWLESGRFEAYGKEMLKIKDRHENDLVFGPTNEEAITDLFRHTVKSYRDLPKNLYQIQWKFRDEIRPRFGIMRAREFLMKDGYSFDINFASAKNTYNKVYLSYLKIFNEIGVKAVPVEADSGAIGGNLSHEFHIIAQHGESEIFYDKEFIDLLKHPEENFEKILALYACSDEKHDALKAPRSLEYSKSIEVGHIFYFGKKYSETMKAFIMNEKGEQIAPEMGSYGIGVSRVVAAVIEASHDDKGIIWPYPIAPFKVSLLNLKIGDSLCDDLANKIYQTLEKSGDILYDNSLTSPGVKFATHDLIGSPWQVIVGVKNAKESNVEIKNRKTGEVQIKNIDEAINFLLGLKDRP